MDRSQVAHTSGPLGSHLKASPTLSEELQRQQEPTASSNSVNAAACPNGTPARAPQWEHACHSDSTPEGSAECSSLAFSYRTVASLPESAASAASLLCQGLASRTRITSACAGSNTGPVANDSVSAQAAPDACLEEDSDSRTPLGAGPGQLREAAQPEALELGHEVVTRISWLLPNLHPPAYESRPDERWWADVEGEVGELRRAAEQAAHTRPRLAALEEEVNEQHELLQSLSFQLRSTQRAAQVAKGRADAAEAASAEANARATASESRATAAEQVTQGFRAELQALQDEKAAAEAQKVAGELSAQLHLLQAQKQALQLQAQAAAGQLLAYATPQPSPEKAVAGAALPLAELHNYRSWVRGAARRPATAPSTPARLVRPAPIPKKVALQPICLGPQRPMYGADPNFPAAKAEWGARVATLRQAEQNDVENRVKGMLSSKSATAVSPREVDAAAQQLREVLARHAIYVDITRCAPCQYSVADTKLNLKTMHGELLARRGGGFDPIMDVIEKLRVPLLHASV